MPLEISDFIEGLKNSRLHFLKHVSGLTPEQIAWKPFPGCKNVTETLQHLIIDDTMALASLKSGEEPDYDSVQVSETEFEALLNQLAGCHKALLDYIDERYGDGPLDATACAWGGKMPAARAIAYLSSEDFYHAGQVAFIRQATDPNWDYYSHVYGS